MRYTKFAPGGAPPGMGRARSGTPDFRSVKTTVQSSGLAADVTLECTRHWRQDAR
jgi:hypothetical protein